jgi:hypothetical protein
MKSKASVHPKPVEAKPKATAEAMGIRTAESAARVKTRDGRDRRLEDLGRLAERAAIYREHHAPDSPLDREAWARKRLARIGRKVGRCS